MVMRSIFHYVAGYWYCVVLCLGACTASAAAPPTLQDAETITIMPVAYPEGQTAADRKETLANLYGTLDEYVYKALLRKLALKGYVLDRPRGWTQPANWNSESLMSRTDLELSRLVPSSATYAAFLFVEQVKSESNPLSSSADGVASAVIIHRESGQAVWRNSGHGKFGENHFLQGLFVSLLTPDKHAAMENAFGEIFSKLPEKQF